MQKINVDIKKTVVNSVDTNDEFHFFVDELTSDDYMPTYMGMADEKYTFDKMDDKFFKFLSKKASEDGIYIRLVHAQCKDSQFELRYGANSEIFKTDDNNVFEFEFADFGIKIKNDEVRFGTTVENGCHSTPYFAEFGSQKGNETYLSVENPLNQYIISIMKKMIFEI